MSDADIESRLDDIYAERIDCIEKITLHGKRPREIGYNARLPTHGPRVSDPVVRLRTSGGSHGISWSRLSLQEAEPLVGRTVGELFHLPEGCTEEGRNIDLPLWDLVARLLEALDVPILTSVATNHVITEPGLDQPGYVSIVL